MKHDTWRHVDTEVHLENENAMLKEAIEIHKNTIKRLDNELREMKKIFTSLKPAEEMTLEECVDEVSKTLNPNAVFGESRFKKTAEDAASAIDICGWTLEKTRSTWTASFVDQYGSKSAIHTKCGDSITLDLWRLLLKIERRDFTDYK